MVFESVALIEVTGSLIILGCIIAFYYKLLKPFLIRQEIETRKSIYDLVLYREFAKSKGIDIEEAYDDYYASKKSKSSHDAEFEEYKDNYVPKKSNE